MRGSGKAARVLAERVALLGNAEQVGVEGIVAVFVVEDGDGKATGGKSGKDKLQCSASRRAPLRRHGAGAVGETNPGFGRVQRDHDLALFATNTVDGEAQFRAVSGGRDTH